MGELLEIADRMRALATTGLHYAEAEFDRERYQKLMGLAARLAALGEGSDPEQVERIYRRVDDGYVTPKLDVRMAIFRGDTILLVRERSDGCWAMPGGYVDVGDSPSEAAVRETAEEAGLDVLVRGLVGVFDGRLQPDAPAHCSTSTSSSSLASPGIRRRDRQRGTKPPMPSSARSTHCPSCR